MGLLLELGKFYWQQTPKAASPITVPCQRPDIPEIPSVVLDSTPPREDECSDDVASEDEAGLPDETWYCFPEYDDADDDHSANPTEDGTCPLVNKIDLETCKLIEIKAVEEMDMIVGQMAGVWSAVEQIPSVLNHVKGVPAGVFSGLAQVKMAAEQWTSVFQQVCKAVSSGHEISDPSLESNTIYLGTKICVSAECFHLYLQNVLPGGQSELKKYSNEIVRMLSLIPKENIPKQSALHKILAGLQCRATTQNTASLDFDLPMEKSTNTSAEVSSEAVPDYRSSHDQQLVLQDIGHGNQPIENNHEQCLHEIFTTGKAGQHDEYLDIAPPKSSVLVRDVEISNIEVEYGVDCTHGEAVDGSDASSESSSSSVNPMNDVKEVLTLSEISQKAGTTCPEAHTGVHTWSESLETMGKEGICEVSGSGSVLEGNHGVVVSGKTKVSLKQMRNRLNSAMLTKLYKDAKTLR